MYGGAGHVAAAALSPAPVLSLPHRRPTRSVPPLPRPSAHVFRALPGRRQRGADGWTPRAEAQRPPRPSLSACWRDPALWGRVENYRPWWHFGVRAFLGTSRRDNEEVGSLQGGTHSPPPPGVGAWPGSTFPPGGWTKIWRISAPSHASCCTCHALSSRKWDSLMHQHTMPIAIRTTTRPPPPGAGGRCGMAASAGDQHSSSRCQAGAVLWGRRVHLPRGCPGLPSRLGPCGAQTHGKVSEGIYQHPPPHSGSCPGNGQECRKWFFFR